MIVVLTLIIALVCCPVPASAADAVPVLELVPVDAPFMIYVEDTPRLIDRWNGSSLASLWSDPEIARFFAPMREELEIDQWNELALEETGYEIKDLISFFSGQALFMMPTMALESETETLEADEVPVLFIAELGERAEELVELLLRQEEKADTEAESGSEALRDVRDFRGVALHIEQIPSDDGPVDESTWAIFDQRLVLATVPSLLEQLIVTSQGDGQAEPVTGNPAFQSALTELGDNEIMAFANLSVIVPEMRKIMAEEADPNEPRLMTPDAIFDALGLEVLNAVFAAFNLDSSGVKMTAGLLASENRGLTALLAYGSGSAPQPSFIPRQAVGFGTGLFDFQEAWAAIESMMDGINPMLRSMAAARITAMTEAEGVEIDLRRDILDNLGDELFTAELQPPSTTADDKPGFPTTSQLIGFSIRQRQGFETAIETLKGMAGQGSELFETRDYLSTTIYTLKQATPGDDGQATPTPQPQGFSYAITDRYAFLCIGEPTTLEATLAAMDHEGPSAWDRPEVKSALAHLPGEASSIQYQDMAVTGHTMLTALSYLCGSSEEMNFCDSSALPAKGTLASHLGPAVSSVVKQGANISIQVYLLPADNAEATALE